LSKLKSAAQKEIKKRSHGERIELETMKQILRRKLLTEELRDSEGKMVEELKD
jgi:hypothetical protein